MTQQQKDELNKELCGLLGICWHELGTNDWVHNQALPVEHFKCKKCGIYTSKCEVDINPDFTSEAGRVQLLKLMMKLKNWKSFVFYLGFSYFSQSLCAQLLEDYFANDNGAFARAARDFLKAMEAKE